jgi:hypothetical protein
MSEREKAGVPAPAIEQSCLRRESEDSPPITSTAPKVLGHVLRDILQRQIELHRRPRDRERNVLQFRIDEMRSRAEKAFAALNGWRVGRVCSNSGWDDHGIHFNRDRRLIAVIGQPYGTHPMHVDELDALVRDGRQQWHAPPMPYASIWFPGRTRFYVVTKPGVRVRWLPEQENETGFAEYLELERSFLRDLSEGGPIDEH